MSNLKMIYTALQVYAWDHDGWLPPEDGVGGLSRLVQGGYLDDLSVFNCPVTGTVFPESLTDETCDYIYRGGGRQSEGKSIVLMDKPGNHPEGRCNIFTPTVRQNLTSGMYPMANNPVVMVMDKPGSHPGRTYCITRSDGSVQCEERKRRQTE